MQNSKPGNKLDPALKAIIDLVYERDKVRYQRICQWVWHSQKKGWSDEVIGQAILLAGEHIHVVNDWWSYLSKLLPKASGRAAEDEVQRYKKDELDFFNVLLGPDWAKKRLRGRQA